MRLGSAARVAATATGIIAVVYVLGVIVLNLVVSVRLTQQNDNRLADRLSAASHDQDVFSQRASRTFDGAGDGDADSAPVFFWLLDARQLVTAQSPAAPVLPTRPLGGQQPRDGLAVTVNAGRAGPLRLEMTRDGTSWLVGGQSLAGVAHTERLLLYAEVLAGPFVLLAMFFGCLVVGQRALAPVEQSRRRQFEFTADASHELRTPLTVLRSELESLAHNPPPASDPYERLGSLLQPVERLSKTVERLFALSRLDAGEAQTEWIEIDLGELVATTADQMLLLAADKGITVTCEAQGRVLVSGDRSRLKQVVVNLLDNAIKYTPANGAVHLRVTAAEGRVVLSVEDSGVGIPAEALPHVFERFYRVDTTRSDDTGGAGLGLAIVKTICDAHGAAVRVASALGRGSAFHVTFPR
jgi:signal transduction histidine kinase